MELWRNKNCFEDVSPTSPVPWAKETVWPRMTHDMLMTRMPFRHEMLPSLVLAFINLAMLRLTAKQRRNWCQALLHSKVLKKKKKNGSENFRYYTEYPQEQTSWQYLLMLKTIKIRYFQDAQKYLLIIHFGIILSSLLYYTFRNLEVLKKKVFNIFMFKKNFKQNSWLKTYHNSSVSFHTVTNLNFSRFYFFPYFESICPNLPTGEISSLNLD